MLLKKIFYCFSFSLIFVNVVFSAGSCPFVEEDQSEYVLTLTPEKAKSIIKYASATMMVENGADFYLKHGNCPCSEESLKCTLDECSFEFEAVSSDEFLEKLNEFDPYLSSLKLSNRGAIVDSLTGMRFLLFREINTDEYILAFGSTGSGFKYTGYRPVFSRLWANACQIAGGIPDIYHQAEKITKFFQGKFGEKITLTGVSLGGSLSSYAAAKNELKAKAFAPVSFHESVAEEFFFADGIENFVVDGDWMVDSDASLPIYDDILEILKKIKENPTYQFAALAPTLAFFVYFLPKTALASTILGVIGLPLVSLEGFEYSKVGKSYTVEPLSEKDGFFEDFYDRLWGRHSKTIFSILKTAYPEFVDEDDGEKEQLNSLKDALYCSFRKKIKRGE